jgi:hypothetical protein
MSSLTKIAQFHNVGVEVPHDANFITADADGSVWAYTCQPTIDIESGYWENSHYGDAIKVANVDLEDMKWEDTLVRIE